jgi:hypothetical protein
MSLREEIAKILKTVPVNAANSPRGFALDYLAMADALLPLLTREIERELEPVLKLPELRDAHWINVLVRRNGKNEVYEADWLKEMRSRARREEAGG